MFILPFRFATWAERFEFSFPLCVWVLRRRAKMSPIREKGRIMAKTDVYKDSASGYLGGEDMHPEKWRLVGRGFTMVDTSENGPLSSADDCEHCPPGSLDGGDNTR